MHHLAIVIGQLSHGGAEGQAVELATGLRQVGGWEPTVFCTSGQTEPNGRSLSAAGVDWVGVPQGIRAGPSKAMWLVREVRLRRSTVVYGVLHVGNIYGGLAAVLLGIPFIASIRSANRGLPRSLRLLSRFVCGRAYGVIANSASCARSLREDMGVSHGRVTIIPNGVSVRVPEAAARARMRQLWGVPGNALVIGTVANLKAEKRPDYFLEAGRRVLGAFPAGALQGWQPIHFVWVGDGAERAAVAGRLSAMEAKDARRFHFPGASTTVPECLAAMDLFVLTSAYEGMPNGLLEAMAMGLPCVATNVPGTRDVLAGHSDVGLLASSEVGEEFAQAVVHLVLDPEQMASMGRMARRHVQERYCTERMVSSHAQVFDRVVAGEPVSGR